jgi:hypothetical protein
MTSFLKFHIKLASENKTTIESLDKQGGEFKSPFDIGRADNLKQIFGVNPYLYMFPIFCGSGKPIGDGIYWPTVQSLAEVANKKRLMEQKAKDRGDLEMNNLYHARGNVHYNKGGPGGPGQMTTPTDSSRIRGKAAGYNSTNASN